MARSRGRDAFHLLRSLATDQPFLIARDDVSAMHEKAAELVRQRPFEAIHADQLWMASYALAAAEAAAARPRLILDQHNAMFLVPQRLAESNSGLRHLFLSRESSKLRHYESETCKKFDDIVWVTSEDQAAVGLRSDGRDVRWHEHVIPICVDPTSQSIIARGPAPFRITFLGGLHWPPNASGINWFAQEIWPSVRAQCPDAVLTIIGKSPPPELSEVEGCEVTGYVADPSAYLVETAAFVVPLWAGGGMRVKVLDAWNWGLPVVATTIGAEGIRYTPGQDLLIADDPAEFAAAVIRVWRDRSLADSLVEAGRLVVEQNYDWRTVYCRWDDIYGAEGHSTVERI